MKREAQFGSGGGEEYAFSQNNSSASLRLIKMKAKMMMMMSDLCSDDDASPYCADTEPLGGTGICFWMTSRFSPNSCLEMLRDVLVGANSSSCCTVGFF